MHRQIHLLFSLFLASHFSLAQSPSDTIFSKTAFPDAWFRAQVVHKADQNKDGHLQYSELAKIQTLVLHGFRETASTYFEPVPEVINITSLKGIELFTNLDSLSLMNLSITELDLSRNLNMAELHIGWMKLLTKLDLSKNAPYRFISANNNILTSYDVSGLTRLETLTIMDLILQYLDIRGTSIYSLHVYSFENPTRVVKVCTDDRDQWNAIFSNDLRDRLGSYTFECLPVVTGLEEAPLAGTTFSPYADYNVPGQLSQDQDSKLVIRKFSNGRVQKLLIK